ncbi:MAG: peptidyl-prolyl cis-trans isomerase [Cyclobacteriaceae bacterium]
MRHCWILLVIILSGCEFFTPKETQAEKPIAKSMTNYLYPSDLDGLFSMNLTYEDSTKLAEKYIDDWARKQLMIAKSSEAINFNEAEIERKVLDYRYALMVHAFEKQFINENLDREVSDEAIVAYYEEKQDNFLLRQNIVKCIFAKIPRDAPNLRQFRRNFREYPKGNMEDMTSYISQFAVKSFLEDSVWIIFDELIIGTPLEKLERKDQFISKNTYSETNDEEFVYFVKILEFKISNEVSPLEFIKDDISNIIINKRKIALKKELEDQIYEDAKQKNLYEIYR